MAIDWVAQALRDVVANCGQIDHDSKLALERAVRAGRISKWRGYWWPVTGAHHGIGPLKTCYGPNGIAKLYAAWKAADVAKGDASTS